MGFQGRELGKTNFLAPPFAQLVKDCLPLLQNFEAERGDLKPLKPGIERVGITVHIAAFL